MKKEYEDLIHEIKIAEKRLLDLKNKAHSYESTDLTNNLNALNNISLAEINHFKDELNKKEQLLEKSEAFLKVGRWAYYFELDKMIWSNETYAIFGCPKDYNGSLSKLYFNCIDERTKNRVLGQIEKLSDLRESKVVNQVIYTLGGEKKLLHIFSSPIFDEANQIIGVEGFVKDLSDQIRGKRGLDKFFNLSFDLHCIVSTDRYFVKVSSAWTKLLGYSEEELLSRSYFDFLHPDDYDISQLTEKKLNKKGAINTFENRYITKSGEVVYLSWNSQIDEETRLAYCTARDITASKLAQDELLSNLSEKELLLREIHHRVKNNLQIISSLLSLQANANSEETQLVKLYEESRDRIRSMAAIHEMFYQSEELDKIEFGKYLNKLISDLSKSTTSSQKPIELTLNNARVFLNLDMAIPLGLLINEIVTNSIKYGADETGVVKIFIELKKMQNGQIELIIGDEGRNSRSGILQENTGGSGIMLINSLVEQINGEIIQLDACSGTVYKLSFFNNKNFNL